MQIRDKLSSLYHATNKKFYDQFGFKIKDVTFNKAVDYLHIPKDSSSLAVTRILFGLAMLFDISDERGGATMEQRWGDPKTCHFPLFPFIQNMGMPYMAIVYAGLSLGALGIMLGYKYRYSAATFTLCYWYLLLIEKSYWNNHSYLFGLVALLLTCTEAHCYWSIDVLLNPSRLKHDVPYWNYFILKYQFFILYFMAGMKKGTAEWLTGYSVQNLSEHWVFEPFRLFLTVPQIDYIIVHWFVFLFDLTVAIWMMCARTRHVAMLFCMMFHLMNSRLFRIGMFPWVCLATMPLFYPFDWPKKISEKLIDIKYSICKITLILKSKSNDIGQKTKLEEIDESDNYVNEDNNTLDEFSDEQFYDQVFDDINDDKENKTETTETNNDRNVFKETSDICKKKKQVFYEIIDDKENKPDETAETNNDRNVIENSNSCKKRITVFFIILHVLSQAFLPYSHFITKGYNNWTDGLYGYSWDMMVHTWDSHSIVLQIVDNDNNKDFYIDPHSYAPNERWTRHGDMVYQYARCLKNMLLKDAEIFKVNDERVISNNISIYVDVWCSLNGRFTQRIFDSKVDILKSDWEPFAEVPYLMPLLDEGLDWREELERMRKDVHSWNNYSDVIFLADFPGYEQEKYISEDLENVTLTVLEGDVVYLPDVTHLSNGFSVLLSSGDHVTVDRGIFHKVLTLGQKPSFYMYTFNNSTESEVKKEIAKLPVLTELSMRFYKLIAFCKIMTKSLIQIFFSFSKCH